MLRTRAVPSILKPAVYTFTAHVLFIVQGNATRQGGGPEDVFSGRLSFARIASFRRTGCAKRRRSLPFPPPRLCENVDDPRYVCWLLGKPAGGSDGCPRDRTSPRRTLQSEAGASFLPCDQTGRCPLHCFLSSCRCAVSGYRRCYRFFLAAQGHRSRRPVLRVTLDAAVMEEDVCRAVFRFLCSSVRRVARRLT